MFVPPVIDISGLRSPNISDRNRVGKELGLACRDTGFFYISNHGISNVDRIISLAKEFFALDRAEKNRITVRNSSNYAGYLELDEEQFDPHNGPDHKEAFSIALELAIDDPRQYDPLRGINQWPNLPGFRQSVLEYYDSCWEIGRILHRGFCHDLGLEECYFDGLLDEPLAGLRLLHYPARLPGENVGTGSLAAGEHTDYGNLAILAVDQVPGLELLTRYGEWVSAPHIENTLICNVGDCLMRWTDDVYISTKHRVQHPVEDRFSAVFFLNPNPRAVIAPVMGGEMARRRYPPIMGADYITSRLSGTQLPVGPTEDNPSSKTEAIVS